VLETCRDPEFYILIPIVIYAAPPEDEQVVLENM
jgi:hypothetical protein